MPVMVRMVSLVRLLLILPLHLLDQPLPLRRLPQPHQHQALVVTLTAQGALQGAAESETVGRLQNHTADRVSVVWAFSPIFKYYR